VNLQISFILKFNTAKVKAIKQFQLQLYGWQLSGRIAIIAAYRALPSRQYGLWVKCGPTGMQVRAVSRKLWGLQCPFAWGGAGSPFNAMPPGLRLPPYQVVSWSIQPFGHNRHGPKSGEAYFQSPKILGRHSPQRMSAIGRGHCDGKIICCSMWRRAGNFVLLNKIHIFCVSFIVYQFSP